MSGLCKDIRAAGCPVKGGSLAIEIQASLFRAEGSRLSFAYVTSEQQVSSLPSLLQLECTV